MSALPADPNPSDLLQESISPASREALPEKAVVAHNVSKTFRTDGLVIKAVQDISFRLPQGSRLGILGGNGAGKSTLINLLSGVTIPTGGYVHRGLSMSWPLGLGSGFFEGHLTGYDNIRFLSRLYQRPFDETFDFVMEFSELSRKQIQTPVKFYSSGMRMRLAFALSLSVDFECILIDEVIVVGDRRFQAKCLYSVFEERRSRSIVLAVHDAGIVATYCDQVLIMKAGRGRIFNDVEYAARIYATL